MKLGISALGFNIEKALEICEEIKEINHIEIGIDNLEDCKVIAQHKDKLEKLNLSIGIHLPMELNPCENIKYIRDSWIEYINKIEKELNDFNIRYFNLHLGYVMTDRLYKNRMKYLNNAIDFFNDLIKLTYAKITIENTYSKKGDFSNVGNKVEDFEYIFNRIENNKICFCYDTGHNLINKSSYLETLSHNIKIIHLSDNDGVEDSHLGIGKGILSKDDIKLVLDTNAKYLILEVDHEHIKQTIESIEIYLKGV
ncbi:MAG: sugar phosphate isomerase/epimerase family protein [Cetobacterium sp.]